MPDSAGSLTCAAVANDFDRVQTLLDLDTCDQQASDDAMHAMSAAINNNNLMIVDLLLQKGFKPSVRDFTCAVKACSYPILALLLQNGHDINEVMQDDCPPPLADALFDPELVSWLLKHGADPNARCRYDVTPFSVAARCASRDVIKLLLEHGASTDMGQPLHYAVRANREDEVVKLLLENGASPNRVMFENDLISYNQFRCLGIGTPLDEAISQSNDRLVRLLSRYGAEPSTANKRGPSL
ncbi:uncharacterized protein PV06_10630 [Exophiala oligosperma]|uniref:Uncharacterized protein n=1 Tax=Exophiala oligosperma TaxID=215243 RepID=A0A0D2DNC6_9EURO|nr:uncharacterized protein PV06_10630 [Exophiala oligosperma]KIW37289.1 hypothetical protein PV06_10630 [Exophiala oligosperma]